MNTRLLSTIFLCSILFIHPWSSAFAAITNIKPGTYTKVNPDIRAYDVHVISRLMPSVKCFGYTPQEWINILVRYNKTPDNDKTIKFYSDLTPDANQLNRSMDRLLPYSVKVNSKRTIDEPTQNKPAINSRICAYQNGQLVQGLIPTEDTIYAEQNVPTGTKLQYWDWGIFSAIVARGSIPQTNGVYDMQREKDITPNTQNPIDCEEKPSGALQKDKKNRDQGENKFVPNFLAEVALKFSCACEIISGREVCPCQCVNTDIYIRSDSTVPYGSYTSCNSAGCKSGDDLQSEVGAIDTAHRADETSQDSGGAANAFRPGLMSPLFEFIAGVIGSPMGSVENQTMINHVKNTVASFSWSFTKNWEVSSDFLNCKLFPYAKRSEMPECNVNWFAQTLEEFMKGMTSAGDTANGTSTDMSIDTSTGNLDGFPESIQSALQHNIPADQIGKDWKAELGITVYNLTTRNPEVMDWIRKYAKQYKLPEKLVAAIMGVESYANKDVSDGRAGEIGLMQVLPRTPDFQTIAPTADVLRDPEKNVEAGCDILQYWLDHENENVSQAIQDYNGSSGSYYVNKVLYFWQMLDSQPEFSTTIDSKPVIVPNPFTTTP